MADTQIGMLQQFKPQENYNKEINMCKESVKHINRLKPAFVIICGDLIDAFPDKINEKNEQLIIFKEI